MEMDSEGARVLAERPRVRGPEFEVDALAKLPEASFGRAYLRFMEHHDFKADDRPVVNHIGDLDLAYILQRYKEVHDFVHTILDIPPTIKGELQVKFFEYEQTELFSTGLSSIAGPLLLGLDGPRFMLKEAPLMLR
jgi:ubiquinone biosynthesis protein COQ4